jgi:hypothetical protein
LTLLVRAVGDVLPRLHTFLRFLGECGIVSVRPEKLWESDVVVALEELLRALVVLFEEVDSQTARSAATIWQGTEKARVRRDLHSELQAFFSRSQDFISELARRKPRSLHEGGTLSLEREPGRQARYQGGRWSIRQLISIDLRAQWLRSRIDTVMDAAREVHEVGSEGEDEDDMSEDEDERPMVRVDVNRASLLTDACGCLIGAKTMRELKGRRLRVRFLGEEGMGEGVTREFITLTTQTLVGLEHGLFRLAGGGRFLVPSEEAGEHQTCHLEYFRLLGRLLGFALVHRVQLCLPFPGFVFKVLVGRNVGLEDLEEVDAALHRSLQLLGQHSVEELGLEGQCFAIDRPGVLAGTTRRVELLPKGRDTPLTNENKGLWAECVWRRVLTEGIRPQLESLIGGLQDVTPQEVRSGSRVNEFVCVTQQRVDFRGVRRC